MPCKTPQPKPGETPVLTPTQPQPGKAVSAITLALDPSTISEGLATTLRGTLKDSATDSGLGARTINLCYNKVGETEMHHIGDVITDSKGLYSYLWSESASLSSGSYSIRASWDGDDDYRESSITAILSVILKGQLVVDPSSYVRLNDASGTNVSANFNLGTSTKWYVSKPLEDWYPGAYFGSYGFGPDCCGYLPYWDVEDTTPGTLVEESPKIVKLDDKTKLCGQEDFPHWGSHSMRIWLKYGMKNDVDRWWYYGVSYPGVAGIKGKVSEITDLGDKVVFEWWAFREKKSESFIDVDHVKAYLMEVVVDINDTSTGTLYRLHYVQDIINQLGRGPEETPTDAYLYEEGKMPPSSWQHYSHDVTYDFQRAFNVVPGIQHKLVDIHLWTRWYWVSCGSSGEEYPTAAIDFDDLVFTKVKGAASASIHFVYAMSGMGDVKSMPADLSAQMMVDGNVISVETENKSFSAPGADMWSDAWDVLLLIPPGADLKHGQRYGSATIDVIVNLRATYSDGSTIPYSATMTISLSDVEWFNGIFPTEATSISIQAP